MLLQLTSESSCSDKGSSDSRPRYTIACIAHPLPVRPGGPGLCAGRSVPRLRRDELVRCRSAGHAARKAADNPRHRHPLPSSGVGRQWSGSRTLVTEPQRDDLLGREPTMTAPNGVPAVPPDVIRRLADRTIGRCVAPAFGVLSKWRGTRALHPDGRSRGRCGPAAPMRLVRYRSAVRLSRGAGLPEPWPDALGLTVRLYDADGAGGVQDRLLTSLSPTVVGRHLVFPARDYGAAFYSSVLPGDHRCRAGPTRRLTHLAEVNRAVGAGLRGFDLLLAQRIPQALLRGQSTRATVGRGNRGAALRRPHPPR
jgi:hypothetical protein